MKALISNVRFVYNGEERFVGMTELRDASNGSTILVGHDYDRGEWRSFRLDRIQGEITTV